jgi:acyl-CoA thioester hydrolase
MSPESPNTEFVIDKAAYRFWTEEKLRNADTDQQGHINNAIHSTLFEAGRIEVLASSALQEVFAVNNIVVVRLLISFKKEMFFPGVATIGTRVSRIGKSSIDFQQAVFGAHGEVAIAEATCVLLDRKTRKPAEVSSAARQFLLGMHDNVSGKVNLSP